MENNINLDASAREKIHFHNLLNELNACNAAKEWAEGKTIEQVVTECHRGDWLLWLAFRLGVNHRKLTLAKAHCANTVRHLMNDDRSTKAIDVAIAYGEVRESQEELKDADAAAAAAADAADAARAAYAAAYADADADAAAYAAAYAAYAAADADADADAAADAADAAYAARAAYSAAYADADADAAAYAARSKNRMLTADICRTYIGQEIINIVNSKLQQ